MASSSPCVVVEILSPATAERDRGHKKALYAHSGVREYWIVDIERRSIEVFSLSRAGYAAPIRYRLGDRLASGAVVGLVLPLLEVFS